jgi:hypothetical protein
MCQMTSTGFLGEGSPDACDAAVWALSDLMVVAHAPLWAAISGLLFSMTLAHGGTCHVYQDGADTVHKRARIRGSHRLFGKAGTEPARQG